MTYLDELQQSFIYALKTELPVTLDPIAAEKPVDNSQVSFFSVFISREDNPGVLGSSGGVFRFLSGVTLFHILPRKAPSPVFYRAVQLSWRVFEYQTGFAAFLRMLQPECLIMRAITNETNY